MKKKKRMKKFRLHEISFVDRPAQQHALALIMKCKDETLFYRSSAQEPVAKKPIQPVAKTPVARPLVREPERKSEMPNSFLEAVGKIRRDQPNFSGTQALVAAREGYPALFKSYQESETELGLDTPVAKSDAVLAFEKAIDAVQLRDRCTRTDAMRKAALENPEALEAYRYA